jgi:serine/threonine protein kinase
VFVCPECGIGYDAPGFCTEHGTTLDDNAFYPLIGTVVGSYRVATLIGQGGMGEVYRGVHPEIGSRVAIKVLTVDAARAPGLVERFFAEARAVNVIRHEGIVTVSDLARLPDGRPYIVMEYLDGAPLSKVFEQHRPMPLGGLLSLLIGIVDALAAAHAHGITHRDLKPDNVFVTSTGRTKVLDFGIAKLRPEIAGLSDATRTGALLGTPFYMSPEQARGQPVDQRSDLYSFGVIAFEGVTGKRPFEADNLFDQLRQQIEAAAPRPRDFRPELPAAFETLILRALEKNPDHRFQTATELGEALRQLAQFLPPESFVTLTGTPSLMPRPMLPISGTGPTAPGYAATVGTTTAVTPRAKSGMGIVFAVGGLIAVIFLVLASVAGALYFFGDNDTITVVNTPAPSATDELPTPASGEKQPTGVVNLNRADPLVFLPKAKELAVKEFPDAALATILVESPQKDGFVDFEKDGTVVYTYFSAKAAAGQMMGRCAVWVTLAGGSPSVMVPPQFSCMLTATRPPRCSVGSVIKASGLKPEGLTMTYSNSSWSLTGEEGELRMVPDNC